MSTRAIEPDHALIKTQDEPLAMEKPRGMTIDEISHQRALLAVKKEFCKDKVLRDLEKIRGQMPFSGGAESRVGLRSVGNIASRVMSGLGYLDYVLLGVSAFNAVKKVTGIFRRRKR